MSDSEESKIEKLKQSLYSRKTKPTPSIVLDLQKHRTTSPEEWRREKKSEEVLPMLPIEEAPKNDFSKKIFLFALGFFAICVAIAIFVYVKGANVISPKNIDIEIIGPTTVASGEETELLVSITNRNDTTIEIADLLVEYPEGTRSAKDALTPLPRDRVAFGDIAPGETARKSVKSVMYGEEGKKQNVKLSLEYRIPNSTSVFNKDAEYVVLVGSSPLTLAVTALKEINSNQDYELTLKIASNSTEPIRDVVLTADYPFGFEGKTFTPTPLLGNRAWVLGDIEPKGEREIKIQGKVYGEANQERFFVFRLGTKDDKDETAVSATIASVSHSVLVKAPFIDVVLELDRENTENYVARPGSEISATIGWTNNLSVPIYDVSIEAEITGSAVSKRDIKASSGFYDSLTNTVRWNKFYIDNLEEAAPGGGGAVELSLLTTSAATNPDFTIDITVKAKRRLEAGVPEEIVSTISRTVRVATAPQLAAQTTYTSESIQNSGPIPPRVGVRTTYAITLTASNSSNALSDTVVTAILPDYVEWTGVISPSAEQVTYNADSREVKWNIGAMPPSGSSPSVRSVSIQVGLTPSISQEGTNPVLLNIAKLSARDTFSGINVSASSGDITTSLKADPIYKGSEGRVEE